MALQRTTQATNNMDEAFILEDVDLTGADAAFLDVQYCAAWHYEPFPLRAVCCAGEMAV